MPFESVKYSKLGFPIDAENTILHYTLLAKKRHKQLKAKDEIIANYELAIRSAAHTIQKHDLKHDSLLRLVKMAKPGNILREGVENA